MHELQPSSEYLTMTLIESGNNSLEEMKFQDESNLEGVIKFKLKGEHFKQKKNHEIYILETNFPMLKIPAMMLNQAKKVVVKKE